MLWHFLIINYGQSGKYGSVTLSSNAKHRVVSDQSEQKWFLFCFLGKTCKVAILTEVLLLGMNVVELMRKCVALCRLQQLPDTSSPLVHFKYPSSPPPPHTPYTPPPHPPPPNTHTHTHRHRSASQSCVDCTHAQQQQQQQQTRVDRWIYSMQIFMKKSQFCFVFDGVFVPLWSRISLQLQSV